MTTNTLNNLRLEYSEDRSGFRMVGDLTIPAFPALNTRTWSNWFDVRQVAIMAAPDAIINGREYDQSDTRQLIGLSFMYESEDRRANRKLGLTN